MANRRDFALGIVVTPPSPATSGTSLTLDTDQGADMPTAPFYVTASPPNELPTKANSEKLLVTDVTGDVLTIERAQGETTAKSIAADWLIVNAIYAEDGESISNDDFEAVATDSSSDFGIGVLLQGKTDPATEGVGIAAPFSLYISANAGVDGSGAWQPGIALESDLQLYSDSYLYARAALGLQLGFNGNSNWALLDHTGVTGNRTLVIPDSDGTFALTSDIDDIATSVTYGETLGGTIDGVNGVFTTSVPFTSIEVFKNGVRMSEGADDDYTVTDDDEITFNVGAIPLTGSALKANYIIGNQVFLNGSNSFITKELPVESANGVRTLFTVQRGEYIGGSLQVFINGLAEGLGVTETDPDAGTFTLDTVWPTGTEIEVSYQYEVSASGNADTVDGLHASATPTASNLFPLDGDGLVPHSTVPGLSSAGIISMLASPGDVTVSGLDFRPSMVEITWTLPNDLGGTTNVYYMYGIATDSSQLCSGWCKNQSTHAQYRWTSTTKCMQIYSASTGALILEGTASLTDDGFVLSLTTTTGTTDKAIWKAWR